MFAKCIVCMKLRLMLIHKASIHIELHTIFSMVLLACKRIINVIMWPCSIHALKKATINRYECAKKPT